MGCHASRQQACILFDPAVTCPSRWCKCALEQSSTLSPDVCWVPSMCPADALLSTGRDSEQRHSGTLHPACRRNGESMRRRAAQRSPRTSAGHGVLGEVTWEQTTRPGMTRGRAQHARQRALGRCREQRKNRPCRARPDHAWHSTQKGPGFHPLKTDPVTSGKEIGRRV